MTKKRRTSKQVQSSHKLAQRSSTGHLSRLIGRPGGLPFLAAMFTAILIAIVAAISAGLQQDSIMVPNLQLGMEGIVRPNPFGATIIGQQNGVNIHLYSQSEVTAGVSVAQGEHVIFTCPANATPNISATTAHAREDYFSTVRFWGYEYSGNEVANMRAGLMGRQLWDGRFWLSARERTDSGGLYNYLDTPNLTLLPQKRYYVMVDEVTGAGKTFRISCLDNDGDALNNAAEDLDGDGTRDTGETDMNDADTDDDAIRDDNEYIIGINPLSADTDGDGLQDGTERGITTPVSGTNMAVFVADADPATTTIATVSDTDGDTYSDGTEDANHNGRIDAGESDPNNPLSVPIPVACGNGVVQGAEECDDGDVTDGDGCSASCVIEEGWECTGEPSACIFLVPELSSGSSSMTAGTSFFVTPASGAHGLNQDFTVNIRMNSSQAIGGINVVLTHSANLQYISSSAGSSVMDVEVTPVTSPATNTLQFVRTTFGAGFTGTNGQLMQLTFRQTAAGTSTITLQQSQSEAIATPSAVNVLSAVSGGSYSAP